MENICVYIHRNKVNNKIYVGQTRQNPLKRWNKGEGYKTSTRFYNAIQKYGWDNFEHIILKDNLSQEEANDFEIYLIKLYNTMDERYGYNIKPGGSNSPLTEEIKRKIGESNKISQKGKHWSDSQRKLMSQKFSGEGNPFYGKHHSDETKKKISDKLKKQQRSGENHPMYGKHHTKESLDKMSNNRKGKGGKRVRCINTGEIFETMMDAARWCGLSNSSSIGQVCNHTGKQTTAGRHPITKEKLKWEFVIEKKEESNER